MLILEVYTMTSLDVPSISSSEAADGSLSSVTAELSGGRRNKCASDFVSDESSSMQLCSKRKLLYVESRRLSGLLTSTWLE